MAVLLTILTMLSTPILTCIFGDGSLEVNRQSFMQSTRKSLLSVLNQGEDTEDWAYEEPAVMEVKSSIRTSTAWIRNLSQQENGEDMDNPDAHEVRQEQQDKNFLMKFTS